MSFVNKRIVLSGYYGFDNIGDEAILFSIISDLKRLNITPIVLSSNPAKTSEVFNVEAVDRMNMISVFKTIKNSDGLISGGGSLLQDVTSKKSPLYYLGIMKIAQLFNVPVYFYAQGVGPINQTWIKPIIRSVISKCSYISVRDSDSYDFLKEIGVKENIFINFDPVLSISDFLDGVIKPLPSNLSEFLKSKPILFSLRKWHNSENLINNVVNFIEKMKDTTFLFVPFHFHEDINLLTSIENSLSDETKKRCFFVNEEFSIPQHLEIFNNISLTIGVRLHSLIFSATNNIPFIGVSYDPKIESFLKIYNLNPIFSVDDWNNKSLFNEVNDIISNFSCKSRDIKSINENLSKSGKLGINFL